MKMEQRSKDWQEIRRGRFTASEIHKLMGKDCGENLTDWPKTAQTYILSKVAETFAEPMPEAKSNSLSWGIEHEDEAKAYYEALYKEEIENIGFVIWPENKDCGCSPDGIVKGKLKGLEVKCPFTLESHLEAFMIDTNKDFKKLKPEYYWQVQSSMLFLNYQTWDFVSYHPNFNKETRISCIEIIRDDKDIDLLKERLKLATKVKNSLVAKIKL